MHNINSPKKAVLLAGTVGLCLLSCRGDGNSASSGDNTQCESRCADEYANDAANCEAQTAECMATCTGPEDTTCMWDCEDFEFDCAVSFNSCMARCPCADASASCILNCDSNDTNCLSACADEYLSCAGGDSAYMCVSMCDAAKESCNWDCEDNAVTIDDYLSCREDCASDHGSCLSDCGE